MANTVPTTGAVKAYAEGAGGIQYEDKKENEDEAPKSTNFRFLGSHVHQVVETDENGKPLVKLYFGPNNNPPAIGTIVSPTSKTPMYLYYPDSSVLRYDYYSLPNNFAPTTDTKYDCVFKKGEKINQIRIKGVDKNKGITDDFIIPVVLPTIENKTETNVNCINVELIHISPTSNNNSVSVSCSLPIKIDSVTKKYVLEQAANMRTYKENIDEDGKVSYEVSFSSRNEIQNKGLQITLENLVINQKEDADDGYLPDVVRAKGYISINSSSENDENDSLSKIGSYELRVTTNNGLAISDKQIFVYDDVPDRDYEHDASDGDMTSNIEFVGSSTKWVSGIEYYTSAKMNVTVDNIRYTQPYVTPDTRRIKLNWSNTSTNTSSSKISITGINNDSAADVVIEKGSYLKPKDTSDIGLSVGSVFKYDTSKSNKHNITSSGDVGKFSITLNDIQVYKQDGSTLEIDSTGSSAISDKYIWTHKSSTKPNDYTITFNTDNDVNGSTTYHRYLKAFDPNTKKFILGSNTENPFGSDIENPTNTSYKFDNT